MFWKGGIHAAFGRVARGRGLGRAGTVGAKKGIPCRGGGARGHAGTRAGGHAGGYAGRHAGTLAGTRAGTLREMATRYDLQTTARIT